MLATANVGAGPGPGPVVPDLDGELQCRLERRPVGSNAMSASEQRPHVPVCVAFPAVVASENAAQTGGLGGEGVKRERERGRGRQRGWLSSIRLPVGSVKKHCTQMSPIGLGSDTSTPLAIR